MQYSRRNLIISASVCTVVALAAALWLLIKTPDKPTPYTSGHTQSRPTGPTLDLTYRPAPRPTGEDATAALRPVLARMLEDGTPLARRIEILDEMDSDLTQAEAMAMIHELSIIPTAEHGSAWHSTYIHKLCNLLQDAGVAHDDLASALATVAANRDLPVVYRDYAFQHLRILWRNSRDESTPAGQARMRAIENTFQSLLAQRPETAAQSLLGLHEIRDPSGSPAVADGEISRLAKTLLDSPPAADSIPAHMTAVRVLAERRISGNNGQLRAIAASDAQHSLVRASAVAALGFIGEPADLEFLETLPSDNPVIAGALRHASSSRE